jgi:hypothetical protein
MVHSRRRTGTGARVASNSLFGAAKTSVFTTVIPVPDSALLMEGELSGSSSSLRIESISDLHRKLIIISHAIFSIVLSLNHCSHLRALCSLTLSRDIVTKKAYQKSILGDTLGLKYEPLTCQKCITPGPKRPRLNSYAV